MGEYDGGKWANLKHSHKNCENTQIFFYFSNISTPQKKVKISGVKRSQHVKHKKNYARPTKKQDKATKGGAGATAAAAAAKKVFGKPIGLGTAKRSASKGRKDAAKTKALEVQKVVHRRRAPVNGGPAAPPAAAADDATDDEHDIDDLLGMLDDDADDETNANHAAGGAKRKRPTADEEDGKHHEDEYTHERDVKKKSRMQTVDLLPIKTKTGEIVTRSAEVEMADERKVDDEADGDDAAEPEEEIVDSDDDIVNDTRSGLAALGSTATHAISTADLLIYREHEINRQKFRIANICSSILEDPENKMKNFGALLELMDERINDTVNLFSVRKLAVTSLLEVFKDILPEYRIGQIDLKRQTGELAEPKVAQCERAKWTRQR